MGQSDKHADPAELERALNAIAEELDRVRKESEATRRQLEQRNRQLAATAAVAQATSTPQLDLEGMLERTLEVVLDVTGMSAGWVLLTPQAGGEPEVAGTARLPQNVVEGLVESRPPDCLCLTVLQTRQSLVVHPLHEACPLRKLDLGGGRPATCHATVPLLTRSDVVGVLNLATDDVLSLDEPQLAVLRGIGRQLGVAVENARLWQGLRQGHRLRRQFVEQAMASQEEERRSIARELHDQIGQELTSLLLGLSALEAEGSGSREALTISPQRLQDLKAIVVDTLDSVRDLALGLRPCTLDDLGLVPAVRRALQTFKTCHSLAVDFHTTGLEGIRLDPDIETGLFRIAQEALTNAARHAHAQRISLLLESRAGMVTLIVEDDGNGFAVDWLMLHGPVDKRWLGLYGMRERAELLGGKLTVESAPGAGTTVFVEVPLNAG